MQVRFCQLRLYGMLIAAAIGLGWGSEARADHIATITSSRDAMIFQNNVDNSDGGGIVMYAGTNSAASARRALVGFDIAANIPTGALIKSVQLTLTYGTAAGTGGGTTGDPHMYDISIHRLLNSWGEGDAEAGTGLGGVGQGAPADPGDVTWASRFHGSQSWTNSGGDFVADASASTSVGGLTENVPFTWGSTSLMVADVQQWLDDPSSNAGWILLGNETDRQSYRGFYTREEANASYRPTLTVHYTTLAAVPEPASVLLVLTGAFGILTISRLSRKSEAHGLDRSAVPSGA